MEEQVKAVDKKMPGEFPEEQTKHQEQLRKINLLFDKKAKDYEKIDFNSLYILLRSIQLKQKGYSEIEERLDTEKLECKRLEKEAGELKLEIERWKETENILKSTITVKFSSEIQHCYKSEEGFMFEGKKYHVLKNKVGWPIDFRYNVNYQITGFFYKKSGYEEMGFMNIAEGINYDLVALHIISCQEVK